VRDEAIDGSLQVLDASRREDSKTAPLGLVAFILFVFVRAGPSVFAVWGSLIGGRASTLLFTLGLVSAVQLLRRGISNRETE
jgi:hypothetical protein